MSRSKSTPALIGLVLLLALAAGFWIVVLSPKHKEADELKTQVSQLQQTLSEAQGRASEARLAKKAFPKDYQQLVVIGKAVPEGDETASLLVALTRIADRSHTTFENLTLSTGGSEVVQSSTITEAGSSASPVPPTEAEASLLPLGASVGSANLGVMPYTLTFTGGYFQVTSFIQGVESLIKTHGPTLAVDGRLITIDGFSLTAGTEDEKGSPNNQLKAEFSVTTFLAPPSQSSSAGLTEAAPEVAITPEASEGVQSSPPAAAEAAGATPSSFSTGEAR